MNKNFLFGLLLLGNLLVILPAESTPESFVYKAIVGNQKSYEITELAGMDSFTIWIDEDTVVNLTKGDVFTVDITEVNSSTCKVIITAGTKVGKETSVQVSVIKTANKSTWEAYIDEKGSHSLYSLSGEQVVYSFVTFEISKNETTQMERRYEIATGWLNSYSYNISRDNITTKVSYRQKVLPIETSSGESSISTSSSMVTNGNDTKEATGYEMVTLALTAFLMALLFKRRRKIAK
ncbi:MAG: hypothetical protein ACXAEU_16435 [Candidatus Hodarchaeales archaeon]|jgi:hypothetical protein